MHQGDFHIADWKGERGKMSMADGQRMTPAKPVSCGGQQIKMGKSLPDLLGMFCCRCAQRKANGFLTQAQHPHGCFDGNRIDLAEHGVAEVFQLQL